MCMHIFCVVKNEYVSGIKGVQEEVSTLSSRQAKKNALKWQGNLGIIITF